MKKYIIIAVAIIVIIIGYWLISPLFINKKVSEMSPISTSSTTENAITSSTSPTPSTTSESTEPDLSIDTTITVTTAPTIIASGTFSGFDRTHYGSGTANIIQTSDGLVLRFENDFNVANGPDLYVGFGTDGTYIKGSDLAKLKGNIGSQNYTLPKDFDLSKTNEVWIWCKAFSVPFAKAVLNTQP